MLLSHPFKMRRPIAVLAVLLAMTFIAPTGVVDAYYGAESSVAVAQASFWGDGNMVASGFSSAIVGDVNGDGYDDIVIGEPMNIGAGPTFSKAILVLGKATGWAKDKPLNTIATASFISEGTGDAAGRAVAPAGDVNGDGYDDFLIGAPLGDMTSTDAGQVYLILGKASGWAIGTSLKSADASFLGELSLDNAGTSVTSGDVNGDGLSDIIIGSPGNDDAGDTAGKVYIFLGKASGWAMGTKLSLADATYVGESAADQAGTSVASGGDLNGDGYDDIVIGTKVGMGPGKAYVIFGKPSGWTRGNSLGKPDASYYGEANNDCAGCAVAMAGDVNGDGLDDMLVGAPQYWTGNQFNIGRTYLVFGKAVGWAQNINLSKAGVTFTGEAVGDFSGERVAGMGDLNGDGYSDIIITAPRRIMAVSGNKGEVHVIRGKASNWASIALSAADSSFWGETATDSLGDSVSIGGDVDGDGHADLLMGSSTNPEGGNGCGQTYLLFYDKATPPMVVLSVKAYTAPDYKDETTFALPGDTIYIELRGSDQNATRADLAVLNASSDSSKVPIKFELRETGLATGIYRGPLKLGNRTVDPRIGVHSVKAKDGDKVYLTFMKDITKNVTVTVGRITLVPAADMMTATEDVAYSAHYDAANVTLATWAFETNASWLNWDPLARNITGTPDNSQVGNYWVRVNVSDIVGRSDEHNYTMAVANVPPAILTSDVVTAREDIPYIVGYNSTDDGQGTITWTMLTNASWLKVNSTTGVINGTPRQADIGRPYANVTVHDGNGGTASHYFIIDVRNVNQPPRINTTVVPTATEDQPFSATIQALDQDPGDGQAWSVVTNASWLGINATTGVLSGTPDNGDVGWFYVNVTVRDTALTTDSHNFTVTVLNVNDPPTWADVPKNVTIERASTYTFDVNATDVDKNDHVAYQLAVSPTTATASINTTTGLIRWTPDGSGNYTLNVTATDGLLSIHHVFKITVRPPIIPNHPPMIQPVLAQTVKAGKAFGLKVVASDPDAGDHLNYTLIGAPAGMTISPTGVINWTPTKDQVGAHNITVQVSDGKATANASFQLTVEKAPSGGNQVDKIVLPGIGIAIVGAGAAGAAYTLKTRASKQGQQQQKQQQPDDQDDMDIEEALLVYKDGRLIAHKAGDKKKPDDEVAHKVQAAIRKHHEEGKTMESTVLSHEHHYVMFQKGTDAYLVVLVPGAQSFSYAAIKTPLKLVRALDAFEKTNKDALKAWSGDKDALKSVDDTLDKLL